MILLNKLRKFAKSKGYIFLQRISFPDSNSPLDLMKYLLHYFNENVGNFTIVQIGANDGKSRDDGIYDYVQNHKVKLYAIEPIPSAFEQLKKNYSHLNNVICVNAAIWHNDGKMSIYVVNETDTKEEKWSRYSSFSKEVIMKVKKTDPNVEIIQTEVPSYTLGTLVTKYSIRNINYLQIDTEGLDFEIIKMAFSAKIFPELIRFEHSHLSYQAKIECANLLANHGYGYISQKRDTIAVKT